MEPFKTVDNKEKASLGAQSVDGEESYARRFARGRVNGHVVFRVSIAAGGKGVDELIGVLGCERCVNRTSIFFILERLRLALRESRYMN